jgi:gamma-glutamylcyclotransferase (GGCT)/AIG2-like uncharacterized protein YtfP
MLFAYGTLVPRDEGRFKREGWVADAVRGRLYDLGEYPGLVDLEDASADWVLGYVRSVDMDELAGPLDRYEGVSAGLYRRVKTTTRDKRRVWVYVYARALPESARGPLCHWRPPYGTFLSSTAAHRQGDQNVGHQDP